jgi:hypothetical protein
MDLQVPQPCWLCCPCEVSANCDAHFPTYCSYGRQSHYQGFRQDLSWDAMGMQGCGYQWQVQGQLAKGLSPQRFGWHEYPGSGMVRAGSPPTMAMARMDGSGEALGWPWDPK